MKRKIWLVLALAFALSLESLAALEGSIWYTGKDQGLIRGTNTKKGREDSSVVVVYYHTFSANPIPENCLPGSGNKNSPFTIVKEIDTASPGLLKAFANREPLEVIMRLYRINPTGMEEIYFTITLRGARVSGIRQEIFNTKDPVYEKYTHFERVSFVYDEIVWDHVDTAVDMAMPWEARCDAEPLSDLNFDGIVNILDFSIMADDWLSQSYYY